MTVAILAKERGGTPTGTPARPGTVITHYDVVVTPRTPIRIGTSVHIYALIPARSPTRSRENTRNNSAYTAYDTGIVGEILRIRVAEGSTIEFVVKNENEWSRTTYAHLAIQDIQGTTVQVDLWTRLWHAITRFTSPGTRHIPLENDAIIYRSRARPYSSDEPFRFTGYEEESDKESVESDGGNGNEPRNDEEHDGGDGDGGDNDLLEVIARQQGGAR